MCEAPSAVSILIYVESLLLLILHPVHYHFSVYQVVFEPPIQIPRETYEIINNN